MALADASAAISPSPSTGAPNPSAEITRQIIEVLGLILSTVFLSGINIAISGQLLGYALNLRPEGDDVYTLAIPTVLTIRVKGSHVLAGFASYSMCLAIVGVTLSDLATKIFITNLQATTNHWNACQALTAILSVFVCILLAATRLFITSLDANRAKQRLTANVPTPEQRAQQLVQPKEP